MSAQLPFTFSKPRSRRNDPASSHRAEERVRTTGAMRGQRKIAFGLVKQYPGKSSKELARLGSLDRYQLARRLPELLEMKMITRTENGSEDVRWWPVG